MNNHNYSECGLREVVRDKRTHEKSRAHPIRNQNGLMRLENKRITSRTHAISNKGLTPKHCSCDRNGLSHVA